MADTHGGFMVADANIRFLTTNGEKRKGIPQVSGPLDSG